MKTQLLFFVMWIVVSMNVHATETSPAEDGFVHACHAVETCFPGQPESILVSLLREPRSVRIQASPAQKDFSFFGLLAQPSAENFIRFVESRGDWRREFEMPATLRPYGPNEEGSVVFGGVTYACKSAVK